MENWRYVQDSDIEIGKHRPQRLHLRAHRSLEALIRLHIRIRRRLGDLYIRLRDRAMGLRSCARSRHRQFLRGSRRERWGRVVGVGVVLEGVRRNGGSSRSRVRSCTRRLSSRNSGICTRPIVADGVIRRMPCPCGSSLRLSLFCAEIGAGRRRGARLRRRVRCWLFEYRHRSASESRQHAGGS